eukprot:4709074-Prymnesium_polylepis.2
MCDPYGVPVAADDNTRESSGFAQGSGALVICARTRLAAWSASRQWAEARVNLEARHVLHHTRTSEHIVTCGTCVALRLRGWPSRGRPGAEPEPAGRGPTGTARRELRHVHTQLDTTHKQFSAPKNAKPRRSRDG